MNENDYLTSTEDSCLSAVKTNCRPLPQDGHDVDIKGRNQMSAGLWMPHILLPDWVITPLWYLYSRNNKDARFLLWTGCVRTVWAEGEKNSYIMGLLFLKLREVLACIPSCVRKDAGIILDLFHFWSDISFSSISSPKMEVASLSSQVAVWPAGCQWVSRPLEVLMTLQDWCCSVFGLMCRQLMQLLSNKSPHVWVMILS